MTNLFKTVFVLFFFVFAATNSYAQEDEAESSYKLIKKGLYIDAMVGNAELSSKNSSESWTGFGLKVGSKWYFGAMEKVGLGFQINWLRAGYYVNTRTPVVIIAPLNIGFASIWKINDDMGVEGNFNFGVSTFNDIKEEDGFWGVIYNPEVKFRYKRWSAGFDLVRSFAIYDGDGDLLDDGKLGMFSFTAGIKF